jgi:hypothetical protein
MAIVQVEAPLTEDEQNRLQGAAFIKASGAPVVEDHNPRNWHPGGPAPKKARAAGPRDPQVIAHAESVSEASK